MDSCAVKEGCRNILRHMGYDELKQLLSAVTKGQIQEHTTYEMIDAILNFEKSPSGFLRRQKVNRQLLFDYLVRQGEYPDVKATKETLVNNVLYLWNSSSIRTRPRLSPPLNRRPIVSIDQTKCESSRGLTMGNSDPPRSYPSMSSCTYQEFKSVTKTVLTETRTFKDLASIQQTTDYNTQSKISSNMSVAPLISQVPQPVQASTPAIDIERLGVEFSTWFYGLLNKQRTGTLMIKEWGAHHFYPDCRLMMVLKTTKVSSSDTFEGADVVRQRLEALVRQEDIQFNPNLAVGGIKSWMDKDNLVIVLVCGSLHKDGAVIGIFEQKFGLIRDPLMDNNWRIRITDLKIVEQAINRLPTLEDTQTFLAVKI